MKAKRIGNDMYICCTGEAIFDIIFAHEYIKVFDYIMILSGQFIGFTYYKDP